MDSTQQGGGLDREVLGVAIEITDEAVTGRQVSRAQYAELLAELYEAVVDGWPVGALVPYARAAAADLVRGCHRREPSKRMAHAPQVLEATA